MNRFQINIVGESGSGLLSTGEILVDAFIEAGLFVFADREFPSLIKGGYSCMSLVVSDDNIYSHDEDCQLMIGLDKQGMVEFNKRLESDGVLVHGYQRESGIVDMLADLMKRNVLVEKVEARNIAKSVGGNVLMTNVVLIGVLWKLCGLDYGLVEQAVKEKFASKPKYLEIDLLALRAGFDSVESNARVSKVISGFKRNDSIKDLYTLMDGNKSVSLGAVLADVKAYYAYPMSPSSSILSYLSLWSPDTGMMVKQAEDEITAVQLNIGSSFAGTRALTATSGGGFDLMTESLSLAAMIEVPLVLVDVQRPGPATGLPTWTAQGDLDLLKNAGHGEYSRVVVSVSSARDAHEVIQEAFNLAEVWQIPVLVMSEKFIADSIQVVEKEIFVQREIERGLTDPGSDLVSEMRYGLSENGVSPRWIPASNKVPYYANGDEHFIDGRLTEDAMKSRLMIDKRARKVEYLIDDLPEPIVYGEDPEIYVVGYGSTAMVMRDLVNEMQGEGVRIGYVHYKYLYPLRTEKLIELFQSGKKILLIEGNRSGQFGKLIESELKRDIFADKLLKYDGRPFYRKEVKEFISTNLNKNE